MATADFDSIYSSITDKYKFFQKALETKQEEYLSKGYKLTKDGNVDMRGTTNNPEIEKYKKETQAFFDKYREYLKEINEIQNENYESNLEQEEELFNIQKQHDIYKKLAEQQRSKTALDNAKKEYNARVLSNNKEYQDLVKQELDIFNLSNTNNKELTDEQIGNLAKIRKKRLDIENEINKKAADNLTNQVTESIDKWTEKGKTAGESIIKHVSEAFNKFSNYMLFDQLQSGINDLSNAYEQNFTSIAGYSGSDSRDANHEFIKGVLEEVNANDYTKYGLNFNKEVFPEITNAVKEGFMGDEAQEIAISNAIDKKIMPWLDTSSETWTNMQFNLSDERIQSIKGQQLLLQETREGNRLLQDGVVSALLDTMQPTLLNIDANTTSFEDLSAETQATVAYLMQKGYGKQDAIKIANQAIDAYQNPAEALMNNGSPVEMLMGMTSLNGGDLGDIIDTYGDVASMGKGMNAVGRQAMVNIMGVNSGNWTRTSSTFDALAGLGKEEHNKILESFLIDSEAARQLYLSKESNLAENVTATQAHDNNLQNITAETVFGANNIAHGMDTASLILNEVIAIKQWLIKSAGDKLAASFGNFLGNFLGNKLGGKNSSGSNISKILSKTMTGGEGIKDAIGWGEIAADYKQLGGGLKFGGLLGGLTQGGSAMSGGALSGGAATGLGAATVAGGALIGAKGIGILTDTIKNWNEPSQTGGNKNIDNAVGVTTGTLAIAGGGAAALAGLGLASGPVGWAGLIVGGAALAGKALYDYNEKLIHGAENVDILSGEFDNLRNKVTQEYDTKEKEIDQLEQSFYALSSETEKRQLLIENGIIPEGNNLELSNAEMEEYIQNLSAANTEMTADSEDILDYVEGVYSQKSKDEISAAIDNIYGSMKGKSEEEQRQMLKDLGADQTLIDNLMLNKDNGAAENGELWRAFVDKDGKLHGEEFTSITEAIESGQISTRQINNYMKKYANEVEHQLYVTSKNEFMAGIDELRSSLTYLQRYKEYGSGNKEPTDAEASGFDQETYDSYKQQILSINDKNKVKLVFEGLGDYQENEINDILKDYPNSLKGFKAGTSFVPYDNMIAELHYGERVLTNPENKEYTENQLSGNNGISTIQIGLQDIVSAIQQQTTDIITYLQSMNSMSSMSGLSNLNMSATMGATRVVV